jgi:glycosyltransferase involved in cell wall biosynthesis
MKILYFSFVELDMPNACQTHTLGVLKGFGGHGCEIDAIVPRSRRIRPKIPNVRFYYLWPWRFSNVGRMWFKLFSFLVMSFLCLKGKYYAIYVREMEMNPGPRWCSKVFKIPLYIEINDLIVPVLSENGVTASYVGRVKRHQKADFKQSSGLIIPSVPMRDWIIYNYNLQESKAYHIINGTELYKTENATRDNARRELGLPRDCYCVGFVGNIYDRYDFYTMLDALAKCRNQIAGLFFVVIGEGPLTPKLKAKASELGIADLIIFMGYIQPDKLGQVMPAFDIGLSLLTEKNALRYGPVTTKLSTYALHKVAVITAGESLEGYPKDLSKGLFLVPPEDSEALKKQLIHFHSHPELSKKQAANLFDYAINNLTWYSVTRQILNIIKSQTNLVGN